VLAGSGRSEVTVSPIKMADWARAATPPPHSVLINQAAAALGIRLPSWQDALENYLALDSERFVRS
jgi:dTDP-4-dehydrorhamnose reductase